MEKETLVKLFRNKRGEMEYRKRYALLQNRGDANEQKKKLYNRIENTMHSLKYGST
jgi:hypothetical protein